METEQQHVCPTAEACGERDDLNWLLHRAAQRMGAAMERHALEAGSIGIRGQLVLSALLEGRQHTQLALGNRLGLDKTTMTSTLDRMEQQELIVRRPDPRDRRVRIPELTEKGRQVQAAVRLELELVERAVLEGLSAEEEAVLRRVLLRLAVPEAGGAGPGGSCV
ncbi:MarR family winged helix-turn-helix transcriptional regulator [Kutzneria kofuensis]|uniref:DNA-binding MarR family transcriptional regulator n=1 Tax=Kutzneria kofuensis TaxID=103725 RepID=A0A7W9KEE3_9PSEU|nr:MarR family winged helix-turn-helix transcriptional regulator [Kutzneria kofuensis]MBB5890922.1 DNA-binding MarR family transcriptional regulator [Kutzneria kofuensis]